MSRENVELHRQAIGAVNALDAESFVAVADPSCGWTSAITGAFGAVYHGHDGIRKYVRDLEDVWEGEFRIQPEAFFDLGEHTLAFFVLRGRGRQSGAEVAMPVATVVRWRDGLAVRGKSYTDRFDALWDQGISIDDLERIEP